jgi:hypothetical protein
VVRISFLGLRDLAIDHEIRERLISDSGHEMDALGHAGDEGRA